jgi:uncharacterized protein (TIGR00661 family)
MQPKPLRILVSPLDWGLGHASRCIPVIRQLLEAGHNITLAGSGRSLMLLQKEFPELESVILQGFSPIFKQSGGMAFQLFGMLPTFIKMIVKENRELKRLVKLYNLDLVISDNRYGLRNKNIKSIIITHQVMVKAPLWLRIAEYPLYLVSKFLISRFDECWIPDYKSSPGLSGELSHKYPIPANALFIGPLSRFSDSELSKGQENSEVKITAIISGTEPQRSNFEELVNMQLAELDIKATIISGKPESHAKAASQHNLTVLAHASVEEMRRLISDSTLIICRPGYSSIMDLEAMRAKAIFVPTPGQTEQQCLAILHQKLGNAHWRNQDELNLKTDIPDAIKYRGFTKNTMDKRLKPILERIAKK